MKQLVDRAMQYRMAECRRYLGQRLEHKPPTVHQRMRNGELRRLIHPIVVQQDIDIDRTVMVSVVLAFDRASQLAFDLLRERQQVCRRKRSLQVCHGVEKRILRVEPPRLGLLKSRKGRTISRPFGQQRQGCNHIFSLIPLIGA